MNRQPLYTNGNGVKGGPMGNGYHQSRGPQRGGDMEGPLSKTNVFIRGLSSTTTDDDLFNLCSKYGSIVSSKSITNRMTNECKGYGFVEFGDPNDAAVAVRELTNCGYQARMSKETSTRTGERSSSFNNGGAPVGRRFVPDFRRNGGSNGRYNGNGNGMPQFSKTNLYLRGLDATTSDDDLHQLCTRYGNILSAKAIVNRATNECKGYGFVNFDSPFAAEQAVVDLQSKGFQVQMSRENRSPRPILAGGPTSSWQ